MMKISLVVMGKLKEKYLETACNDYAKRLSRYCDLKICEIQPEPLPENPSDALIEAALLKESEKITSKIPKSAKVIALCVEGGKMTSERFAEKIKAYENAGTSLCFIVGSSYGLHETLKSSADLKLSLSDMTFPHGLFRAFLLEQIYRAFKINGGGTYHK